MPHDTASLNGYVPNPPGRRDSALGSQYYLCRPCEEYSEIRKRRGGTSADMWVRVWGNVGFVVVMVSAGEDHPDQMQRWTGQHRTTPQGLEAKAGWNIPLETQ